MIDVKKLGIIAVAAVAGYYVLSSGTVAGTTGGKARPTTGILPGGGAAGGEGSFIFPADTFTGFTDPYAGKKAIVLPESPFIPYPQVTLPLPVIPYTPGKVDDGDDGKAAEKGLLESIFDPLGGREVPAIPKAPPVMGGGLGTINTIWDSIGSLWDGMKEQYAKDEAAKGISGAGVAAGAGTFDRTSRQARLSAPRQVMRGPFWNRGLWQAGWL